MADYNINVAKRTVALSDICVPKAFLDTTPAKSKMDKVNAFYALTGGFGKDIIVNQNMTLLDGYTAYLCAKANRLNKVKVLQATAKAIESKQDKPEPEKEPFVPHLENSAGKHYGVIGKKTDYVDAVGRPLCVGDIVELFKNGCSRGKYYVVERKLPWRGDKEKVFVMSIERDCENGSIVSGWKAVKVKDHSDLKNGENDGYVVAYLSEH